MKRLTLDKAWTGCIKMWESICCEQIDGEVEVRKEVYCKANNLKLHTDCFFCEYAKQHPVSSNTCVSHSIATLCSSCPARSIESSFNCGYEDYHYRFKPKKFLAKIKKLYKIYEKTKNDKRN